MFVKGQEYKRTDLHARFRGQGQGGISTPSGLPIILLFSSRTGEQYGYSDGWKDGIYYYVGEGQRGNMEYVRGNAAIRDHIFNGKDLHLFSYVRKGLVQYAGQMVCTGSHYDTGADSTGLIRQVIVFELVPFDGFLEIDGSNEVNDLLSQSEMASLSLEELRTRALAASVSSRNPVERKQDFYYRSQAIKLYAHKRAHGICEGCSHQAPFETKEGKPYLEVHHIRRLSDGGPDDPRWVVAICPNCHRRAHYSKDAASYNAYLAQMASQYELTLR